MSLSGRWRRLRARQSRRLWNRLTARLGEDAVLTGFSRAGHADPEAAFLASGEADVARDFARVMAVCPEVGRAAALDFGCGPGRLTAALARRFARVVGVDISDAMLDRARARLKDQPHVTLLRVEEGLKGLENESFDFIYSLIVLQHMPPALAAYTVEEFCRVCRPGGVVCFQAVDRLPPRLFQSFWPDTFLSRLFRQISQWIFGSVPFAPTVQMYALPRPQIERIAQANALETLAIDPEASAGAGFRSYRYILRKSV